MKFHHANAEQEGPQYKSGKKWIFLWSESKIFLVDQFQFSWQSHGETSDGSGSKNLTWVRSVFVARVGSGQPSMV